MSLTEETAASIAAAWSTNFTALATGNDIAPFVSMFADKAQLTAPPGAKVATLAKTKDEADPANGIITAAMMQAKMVPEFEAVGYKMTVMTCKGVQGASFLGEVKRYNASGEKYFTQFAVIDVSESGLITKVRAFSEPTVDKANTALLSALE
uniref:SnoaL-like domain-containing protein n=1 Tax=Calcidiscus leptoporus TaxID=127549 RepID=A0A7S0IWF5_9EUKA|mmetsp:Transcript_26079/g.60905  ORF Transcript_26079/g.60905 Transcript_26079/m.60905 type:complete len:152 (+) Transcript_26079:35-490(+)|eukprot:CAMPEP_0119373914 /NCGR_PEP_ID=MMETSP1334-20130426/27914_1 /TAXON_ID=127549 /ORGANISM="Calcidiscus leptoporus, Strain RCC1130" /LENGTH=151 /DNA_ID=CAMNT_0007391813 /DNA_START=44 /DNA_END=499 /DNA_ORIENTATION=-